MITKDQKYKLHYSEVRVDILQLAAAWHKHQL